MRIGNALNLAKGHSVFIQTLRNMIMKRTLALIILSTVGSSKLETFALTEDEVSIGRSPSNRITIGDSLVSRRHCLIKREAGQYKISDLDSFNGIFVNEGPTKERFLQDGDLVRIGHSLLFFLLREAEAQPTSSSFSPACSAWA